MVDVPRITGKPLPEGEKVGLDVRLDPRGIPYPFSFEPLTDDMAVLIAQIVVTWARFERAMNVALGALLKSKTGNTPQAGWDRTPFDDRRKKLRREVAREFPTQSAIAGYFNTILDDAGEIQIIRNTILHGHLAHRMRAVNVGDKKYRTEIAIVASGRQKKQDVEFTLDYAALDHLFIRLGHLCGKMEPPFSAIPGASSEDIQALEILLTDNHHPPA